MFGKGAFHPTQNSPWSPGATPSTSESRGLRRPHPHPMVEEKTPSSDPTGQPLGPALPCPHSTGWSPGKTTPLIPCVLGGGLSTECRASFMCHTPAGEVGTWGPPRPRAHTGWHQQHSCDTQTWLRCGEWAVCPSATSSPVAKIM